MVNEIIKDSNGKISSKRVLGIIGISIFFIVSVTCVFFSVFKSIPIDTEAAGLLKAVGIAGASLLGVGVLESFGTKK